MDFIIGGAYQGKLEYAKEKYKLNDNDIFTCKDELDIDLTKRCIYHFEKYAKALSRVDKEELPEFRDDAIIIMDDIFCGVVPIDPEIRKFRETAGRLGGQLTKKANTVTRLFCGIAQEIK